MNTDAQSILQLLDASNVRANAKHYVHPGSNHFYLCRKDAGYILKTLGDSREARQLVCDVADRLDELPARNEAIKVLVDVISQTIAADEGANAELREMGFETEERITNLLRDALTRALAILKNEHPPTVGV
jgi:hypothetical protein